MKRTPSPAQVRWTSSEEFREIARASALKNLRMFAETPKCGARRKYDGQPCQKPGLGTGGRCRWHGGRTPKGPGKWQLPLWPDKSSANLERKLQSKLATLERRRKERARILAGLTPEQRAQYDRWKKSHDPHLPSGLRRKQPAAALDLDAGSILSPELAEELAVIHAEIERLRALLREAEQQKQHIGVFA